MIPEISQVVELVNAVKEIPAGTQGVVSHGFVGVTNRVCVIFFLTGKRRYRTVQITDLKIVHQYGHMGLNGVIARKK